MSDDLEYDWALLRPHTAKSYVGRRRSFLGPIVFIVTGEERIKLTEGTKVNWGPDTGGKDHHLATQHTAYRILLDHLDGQDDATQRERAKNLAPGFAKHVVEHLPALQWELTFVLVHDAVEILEDGGIPRLLDDGQEPDLPNDSEG